jgi:eukaryotic-like serine/threonine-protein kinase
MNDTRASMEEARKKRRKRNRIIWLSVAGALAVFIVFYSLYGFTDIFIGASQKTIESSPQPQQQDNWTMFRRDIAHSGISGASEAVPAGKIKWTFPAAGVIHSSPAVVNGVVYFGSRDSHLYAVNAATGEKIWAFQTGSWVESSPAVVDGIVYFGCNDSNLYAVDAKTGTELWRFKSVYALRSSPAVANGVVYIGADNYRVYAIDAATGKEKWDKETDNLVVSSPVVSKGIVTVGSSDGYIYTFNAGNGKQRLAYNAFSVINASPVIKDGVAYFADNRGLFQAIDISQKNWLWENKLKQYWNALYIYGVAPKPSPPSGFLWSLSMVKTANTVSSVVLNGNNAFVGVGNNVISIDLTSHKIAWTFKSPAEVTSTPVIVGNTVLFGGLDGRLYALDQGTGSKLWDIGFGAAITSSPAVANGVLYVGCDDGKLYAIE